MNLEEANEKILKLMNKSDLLSQEEIKLFKELIFQCDLKQQNYMIYTPLMFAFINNKDQNLNINEEQWDYLIKNSDLKPKNNNFKIPLIYVLRYNQDQNINLNKNQWDYLIKNSDLKQQNNNGWKPLMWGLYYNQSQNLKLTKQHFQEMYDALDEKQKQITFQKIIQENNSHKNTYLKEINILLYDCEFKPNKETIHWLKENNYQDILKMIEKKDILYCLENNLNNNKKNINKIKI